MKKMLIICFLSTHGLLLAQDDPEYEDRVDQLFQAANQHLFTHKDSANHYFETLFNLSAEWEDWETCLTVLQYVNYICGYHYDLTAYKQNLDKSDSVFNRLSFFLDSISNGYNFRISHLIDKGNYYFKVGDNSNSRAIFYDAIGAIERVPDSVITDRNVADLSNAYSFIASTYANENKYDLAKEFYQKNLLTLQQDNIQVNQDDINNTFNLIAAVHTQEGDYELANQYLSRTLDYYLNPKVKRYKNNIVSSMFLMAQNYIKLTDFDSAKHILDVSKTYLLERDPFLPKYYQILGQLYQHENNFEKALEAFDQQLKLTVQKWQRKHSEAALVYNSIGVLHKAFDKENEAILAYQKALQQLSENFESNDYTSNPKVSNVQDRVTFFNILKNKTITLNSINVENYYQAAAETADIAIVVLDSLKPTIESETDKLSLVEDAFPMFEAAIEAAYELYLLTGDLNYIDKAFSYSEKSKSTLLLETLLSARANAFSGISKELLEKEKQLKSLVTHLEKQVRSTNGNPVIRGRLFETKEDHRRLISEIEHNHRNYYDLKYNTQVTDIEKAQTMLRAKEVMVSYFYGDEAIYVITVTKKSKDISRILFTTDLIELVTSIHQMLSSPKTNIQELAKVSYQLYGTLLKSSLEDIDHNRLIVIPDGFLHYIPFGSLNTNPEGNPQYLIEQASVSYVNSATLLEQLNYSSNPSMEVLAFAPNFDESLTDLQDPIIELLPLPHSETEVNNILSFFEGQLFIGNDASVENFMLENDKYSIIHLATHAVVDDQAPEYSYLAFTPQKDAEYLLFVSDLYNLDLKANLVTLSACETGIGDLKRGEGFISLSRAFFYAGATSIANTKWKVNDIASSQIMEAFYKYLSLGKKKDQALRQAKLDFLETNRQNNLKHPYYWSGVVISGSINSLTSRPQIRKWILPFVLMLISTLWVYMKKRKSVRS